MLTHFAGLLVDVTVQVPRQVGSVTVLPLCSYLFSLVKTLYWRGVYSCVCDLQQGTDRSRTLLIAVSTGRSRTDTIIT